MSVMLRRSGWMVVGLLPVLAAAQAGRLVIPDFGDLARKATESVDITLDGDMLKSATYLMGAAGGRNSGDTDLSSLVAGLKAITVRSFTFDKPDMYSRQAVDSVLAQVDMPGWQKVVSVREKGERVEIHMRPNSEDGGLLIVTEEPKELTIVNIAGKINMDQLRQLQGHLGVPNMPGLVGGAGSAATPAPPVPPAAPVVVTPAPPAPAAQQAAPATPAPVPAQRG
ncbi:MAG TPA: DUF4252 domain-containing protein [Steroidobacteraceae bacterium]|nr:DUF4252 domain-containing protein [Steroidobacteraceae bacterium]